MDLRMNAQSLHRSVITKEDRAFVSESDRRFDKELLFRGTEPGKDLNLELSHSDSDGVKPDDRLAQGNDSTICLTRISDTSVSRGDVQSNPDKTEGSSLVCSYVSVGEVYVSKCSSDGNSTLETTEDSNRGCLDSGKEVTKGRTRTASVTVSAANHIKPHYKKDAADLGASVKAATLTSSAPATTKRSQLMSPPSRKKGGVASKENVCGRSRDRNHVDKHGVDVTSGERIVSGTVRSNDVKASRGRESVTSSSTGRQSLTRNVAKDVSGMTSLRSSAMAAKVREESVSRKPLAQKASSKVGTRTSKNKNGSDVTRTSDVTARAVTVVVREATRADSRSASPKEKQSKEFENRKQKSASPQPTARLGHHGDSGKMAATDHLGGKNTTSPRSPKSFPASPNPMEPKLDGAIPHAPAKAKAFAEEIKVLSSPEKEKMDSPTKETAEKISSHKVLKKDGKPAGLGRVKDVRPSAIKSGAGSGSILQKQASRLPKRSTEKLAESQTLQRRATSSSTVREPSSSKPRMTSSVKSSSSVTSASSASSASKLSFKKTSSPDSDVSGTSSKSSRSSLMSSTSSSRLKAKGSQNDLSAKTDTKYSSRSRPTEKSTNLKSVTSKGESSLRLKKTSSPSGLSECSVSTRDSSVDSRLDDDSHSVVSNVSHRSNRSTASSVSSSRATRNTKDLTSERLSKTSKVREEKSAGLTRTSAKSVTDRKKRDTSAKSTTVNKSELSVFTNKATAIASDTTPDDTSEVKGKSSREVAGATEQGEELPTAAAARKQTRVSAQGAENWKKVKAAVKTQVGSTKGSSQKSAMAATQSKRSVKTSTSSITTSTAMTSRQKLGHSQAEVKANKPQVGGSERTSIPPRGSASSKAATAAEKRQQQTGGSRVMKTDEASGAGVKGLQSAQERKQAREIRDGKHCPARSPSPLDLSSLTAAEKMDEVLPFGEDIDKSEDTEEDVNIKTSSKEATTKTVSRDRTSEKDVITKTSSRDTTPEKEEGSLKTAEAEDKSPSKEATPDSFQFSSGPRDREDGITECGENTASLHDQAPLPTALEPQFTNTAHLEAQTRHASSSMESDLINKSHEAPSLSSTGEGGQMGEREVKDEERSAEEEGNTEGVEREEGRVVVPEESLASGQTSSFTLVASGDAIKKAEGSWRSASSFSHPSAADCEAGSSQSLHVPIADIPQTTMGEAGAHRLPLLSKDKSHTASLHIEMAEKHASLSSTISSAFNGDLCGTDSSLPEIEKAVTNGDKSGAFETEKYQNEDSDLSVLDSSLPEATLSTDADNLTALQAENSKDIDSDVSELDNAISNDQASSQQDSDVCGFNRSRSYLEHTGTVSQSKMYSSATNNDAATAVSDYTELQEVCEIVSRSDRHDEKCRRHLGEENRNVINTARKHKEATETDPRKSERSEKFEVEESHSVMRATPFVRARDTDAASPYPSAAKQEERAAPSSLSLASEEELDKRILYGVGSEQSTEGDKRPMTAACVSESDRKGRGFKTLKSSSLGQSREKKSALILNSENLRPDIANESEEDESTRSVPDASTPVPAEMERVMSEEVKKTDESSLSTSGSFVASEAEPGEGEKTVPDTELASHGGLELTEAHGDRKALVNDVTQTQGARANKGEVRETVGVCVLRDEEQGSLQDIIPAAGEAVCAAPGIRNESSAHHMTNDSVSSASFPEHDPRLQKQVQQQSSSSGVSLSSKPSPSSSLRGGVLTDISKVPRRSSSSSRTCPSVRKLMTTSHPPLLSSSRLPGPIGKQRPKSSPCLTSSPPYPSSRSPSSRMTSQRTTKASLPVSLSASSLAMSSRATGVRGRPVMTPLPFRLQRGAAAHTLAGARARGGKVGAEREGLASVLPADTALPSEEPWTLFPAGNAAATGSACLSEQQDAGEERAADSEAGLAEIADVAGAGPGVVIIPRFYSSLSDLDSSSAASLAALDFSCSAQNMTYSATARNDKNSDVTSGRDGDTLDYSCSAQNDDYSPDLPGIADSYVTPGKNFDYPPTAAGGKSRVTYSPLTVNVAEDLTSTPRSVVGATPDVFSTPIGTLSPENLTPDVFSTPLGSDQEREVSPDLTSTFYDTARETDSVIVNGHDSQWEDTPTGVSYKSPRSSRSASKSAAERSVEDKTANLCRTGGARRGTEEQFISACPSSLQSDGAAKNISRHQSLPSTVSSSEACSVPAVVSEVSHSVDSQLRTAAATNLAHSSVNQRRSADEAVIESSTLGGTETDRLYQKHSQRLDSSRTNGFEPSTVPHPASALSHDPTTAPSSLPAPSPDPCLSSTSDSCSDVGMLSARLLMEVCDTQADTHPRVYRGQDSMSTSGSSGELIFSPSTSSFNLRGESCPSSRPGSRRQSEWSHSASPELLMTTSGERIFSSSPSSSFHNRDSSPLLIKETHCASSSPRLSRRGRRASESSRSVSPERPMTGSDSLQFSLSSDSVSSGLVIHRSEHVQFVNSQSVSPELVDNMSSSLMSTSSVSMTSRVTSSSVVIPDTRGNITETYTSVVQVSVGGSHQRHYDSDAIYSSNSRGSDVTHVIDSDQTGSVFVAHSDRVGVCSSAVGLPSTGAVSQISTVIADVSERGDVIAVSSQDERHDVTTTSSNMSQSQEARREETRTRIKVSTKKSGPVSAKPISTCVQDLQKKTQEEHTGKKKPPQPVTLTSVRDSVMKFETTSKSKVTVNVRTARGSVATVKRSSSSSSTLRTPEDKSAAGKLQGTRLSRSVSTSRKESNTTSNDFSSTNTAQQATSSVSSTVVSSTSKASSSKTAVSVVISSSDVDSKSETPESALQLVGTEIKSHDSEKVHAVCWEPEKVGMGEGSEAEVTSLEGRISERLTEVEGRDSIALGAAEEGDKPKLLSGTEAALSGHTGVMVKSKTSETAALTTALSESAISSTCVLSVQKDANSNGAQERQTFSPAQCQNVEDGGRGGSGMKERTDMNGELGADKAHSKPDTASVLQCTDTVPPRHAASAHSTGSDSTARETQHFPQTAQVLDSASSGVKDKLALDISETEAKHAPAFTPQQILPQSHRILTLSDTGPRLAAESNEATEPYRYGAEGCVTPCQQLVQGSMTSPSPSSQPPQQMKTRNLQQVGAEAEEEEAVLCEEERRREERDSAAKQKARANREDRQERGEKTREANSDTWPLAVPRSDETQLAQDEGLSRQEEGETTARSMKTASIITHTDTDTQPSTIPLVTDTESISKLPSTSEYHERDTDDLDSGKLGHGSEKGDAGVNSKTKLRRFPAASSSIHADSKKAGGRVSQVAGKKQKTPSPPRPKACTVDRSSSLKRDASLKAKSSKETPTSSQKKATNSSAKSLPAATAKLSSTSSPATKTQTTLKTTTETKTASSARAAKNAEDARSLSPDNTENARKVSAREECRQQPRRAFSEEDKDAVVISSGEVESGLNNTDRHHTDTGVEVESGLNNTDRHHTDTGGEEDMINLSKEKSDEEKTEEEPTSAGVSRNLAQNDCFNEGDSKRSERILSEISVEKSQQNLSDLSAQSAMSKPVIISDQTEIPATDPHHNNAHNLKVASHGPHHSVNTLKVTPHDEKVSSIKQATQLSSAAEDSKTSRLLDSDTGMPLTCETERSTNGYSAPDHHGPEECSDTPAVKHVTPVSGDKSVITVDGAESSVEMKHAVQFSHDNTEEQTISHKEDGCGQETKVFVEEENKDTEYSATKAVQLQSEAESSNATSRRTETEGGQSVVSKWKRLIQTASRVTKLKETLTNKLAAPYSRAESVSPPPAPVSPTPPRKYKWAREGGMWKKIYLTDSQHDDDAEEMMSLPDSYEEGNVYAETTTPEPFTLTIPTEKDDKEGDDDDKKAGGEEETEEEDHQIDFPNVLAMSKKFEQEGENQSHSTTTARKILPGKKTIAAKTNAEKKETDDVHDEHPAPKDTQTSVAERVTTNTERSAHQTSDGQILSDRAKTSIHEDFDTEVSTFGDLRTEVEACQIDGHRLSPRTTTVKPPLQNHPDISGVSGQPQANGTTSAQAAKPDTYPYCPDDKDSKLLDQSTRYPLEDEDRKDLFSQHSEVSAEKQGAVLDVTMATSGLDRKEEQRVEMEGAASAKPSSRPGETTVMADDKSHTTVAGKMALSSDIASLPAVTATITTLTTPATSASVSSSQISEFVPRPYAAGRRREEMGGGQEEKADIISEPQLQGTQIAGLDRPRSEEIAFADADDTGEDSGCHTLRHLHQQPTTTSPTVVAGGGGGGSNEPTTCPPFTTKTVVATGAGKTETAATANTQAQILEQPKQQLETSTVCLSHMQGTTCGVGEENASAEFVAPSEVLSSSKPKHSQRQDQKSDGGHVMESEKKEKTETRVPRASQVVDTDSTAPSQSATGHCYDSNTSPQVVDTTDITTTATATATAPSYLPRSGPHHDSGLIDEGGADRHKSSEMNAQEKKQGTEVFASAESGDVVYPKQEATTSKPASLSLSLISSSKVKATEVKSPDPGSRSPVPTRLSEGLKRFQKSRGTPWGQQYVQRGGGDRVTSPRSKMAAASNWQLLLSKMTVSAVGKETTSPDKDSSAQNRDDQSMEMTSFPASQKKEVTVTMTKTVSSDSHNLIDIETVNKSSRDTSRVAESSSDSLIDTETVNKNSRDTCRVVERSSDSYNVSALDTTTSDTRIETTFSETIYESVVPASPRRGGTPKRSTSTPDRSSPRRGSPEKSRSERSTPERSITPRRDTPERNITPGRYTRETDSEVSSVPAVLPSVDKEPATISVPDLVQTVSQNGPDSTNAEPTTSSPSNTSSSSSSKQLRRQDARSKINDLVDESVDDKSKSEPGASFYQEGGDAAGSDTGVPSPSSSSSLSLSPRRGGTSTKLISVTVWDTHDGDKTLRSGARRVFWDLDSKELLAGISEHEEQLCAKDDSRHKTTTTTTTTANTTTATTTATTSPHVSRSLQATPEKRRDTSRDRDVTTSQPQRRRRHSRRSLSLPTGGLSYGDVKITYRDGHFVTEPAEGEVSNRSSSRPRYDRTTSDSGASVLCGSLMNIGSQDEMRDEILSLLERGFSTEDITVLFSRYLDQNSNHLGESGASSASQSTQSLTAPGLYSSNQGPFSTHSLPRRRSGCGFYTRDALNRPASVDEVQLWQQLSQSEQSLASEGSSDDSTMKRTESFYQAMGSSVYPRRRRGGGEEERAQVAAAAARRRQEEEEQVERERVDSSSAARLQRHNSEESKGDRSRGQRAGFFQRMLQKRKSFHDKPSNSETAVKEDAAASQRKEARDNVAKKVSIKGIFRRKNSTTSLDSRKDSEDSSTPPIATFLNDDDIGAISSLPGSPNSGKGGRRAHSDSQLRNGGGALCSTSSDEVDKASTTVPPSLSAVLRRDPMPLPGDRGYAGNRGSERFSGEYSNCDFDLVSEGRSSVDTRSSADTLTPLSTSPSPSTHSGLTLEGGELGSGLNRTLDLDSTLLASPGQLDRTRVSLDRTPVNCVDGGPTSAGYPSRPARKPSFPKQEFEKLAAIVQGEITSSNSNDSGIQHDVTISSSESLKLPPEVASQLTSAVKLRNSPSPKQERPKSDFTVRWADLLEQVKETNVTFRRDGGKLRKRPRPKSDLGGSSVLPSDAFPRPLGGGLGVPLGLGPLGGAGGLSGGSGLCQYDSQVSLAELRRPVNRGRLDTAALQAARLAKSRRMSTPQPIKTRVENLAPRSHKQTSLVRSHSMPDNLDRLHRKKNYFSLIGCDMQSEYSHNSGGEDSSDESEFSVDYNHEKSLSTRASRVTLATLDQMIEEESLTYAEALWDHVTMDVEELGFKAGELIRVTDMTSERHWWFGATEHREGWFPSSFVRLRVNQDDLEGEMTLRIQEEEEEIQRQLLQQTTSSPSTSNKTHLRSNVVNEIITAETEYVKHLRDVIEGYLKQARKRPEMFPVEKVTVIFSNIEEIYNFAVKLLGHLQSAVNKDQPHLTEFGQCFLSKTQEFEIYSEYCNNHPAACEELREMYRVKRFRHFFEACRLLQEMSEIPLEGFLLTPVQKICKYHLQLGELLKYTPTDHPDYGHVQSAVEAMKKIAKLVNERKRKMESIETLAEWQMLVDDWEGPDILDDSSELIYSGELNKINANGWSQERYFFLFDHQLVYCKKDLLKKNSFGFKGRIHMDQSIVVSVPDGRDAQYNVNVRNGLKIHDQERNKWFLMVAKTAQIKQRWLKAFSDERRRVHEDMENNFNIPFHLKQAIVTSLKLKSTSTKSKGKRKAARGNAHRSSKSNAWVSTNATLPRESRPSTLAVPPGSPSLPQQSNRIMNFFLLGGKKK
ncbi:serine-rich adhesin for platelets-like isoform X2 [Littorina saxatilis]|uniref:serine-rich adhesin for platelets-like isoform X2 n=1 Tax=Littorina saxatilis TaxID=31220 RepID=UPI0038B56818